MRGNTGELYGAEAKNEQLIVLIDGERVGAFDMAKVPNGTDNDKNELRLKVKAGYRTVGFTFLANTHIPGDDLNQHYIRSVLDTNPIPGFIFSPQVGQVKVLGPYNGDHVHRRGQPQKDSDVHPLHGAAGDRRARRRS